MDTVTNINNNNTTYINNNTTIVYSNTTTINGITYWWNNDICYYLCTKRNKYIPCRNVLSEMNRTRFFIDETVLTYEQMSNYDTYRSVLEMYCQYEEWRESPNFPGYAFSSYGRFKLKTGTISISKPKDDGYIKVSLSSNGSKINIALHRVIAYLFIPNDDPINKTEVDHLNGIRHDARVINLMWKTPSENNTNKIFMNENIGKKISIPVNEFDLNGNFIRKWESTQQIINEKTGNDTIYYNLDTNISYFGSYWFREKQELLEGEEFKPLYLKDVDSTIYVSNKGRICNTSSAYKRSKNIITGSKSHNGYMRVSIKNKEYKIHQLVLMAFDPDGNIDGNMVPDHIDSCKTNNNVENLEWVSYSENTQRHYNKKREIKEENKKNGILEPKKKSSLGRRVILTQIGTQNEWIFDSIVEAIEKTGFTKSQINSILLCRTKNNLVKDNSEFTVRYADNIIKEKIISKNRVPVIQMDLNGNDLFLYESIAKATETTGIFGPNIERVCRGEGNTSGGFKWRYADPTRDHTREKPVIQLSNENAFMAKYPNIIEAAKTNNICDSSIASNCRGNSLSAGGYIWMYKDDYISKLQTQMDHCKSEAQIKPEFYSFYLKQYNELLSILNYVNS